MNSLLIRYYLMCMQHLTIYQIFSKYTQYNWILEGCMMY